MADVDKLIGTWNTAIDDLLHRKTGSMIRLVDAGNALARELSKLEQHVIKLTLP